MKTSRTKQKSLYKTSRKKCDKSSVGKRRYVKNTQNIPKHKSSKLLSSKKTRASRKSSTNLKFRGGQATPIVHRKSSFKRKPSHKLVRWSPDVTHIERPKTPRPNRKSSKCKLLIKLDTDKTFRIEGKLFAKHNKTKGITLKIVDDTHTTKAKITAHVVSKKILFFETLKCTATPGKNSRIRFKLDAKNAKWDDNQTRSISSKGFDVSWLNDIKTDFKCNIEYHVKPIF